MQTTSVDMPPQALPVKEKKPRKPRTYRENPVPLDQRHAMSPRDAADYAGIGFSTLYLYMKHGYIPYTKIGRSTRIKRADLDAFLAGDRPTIPQEPKNPQ